MLKRNIVGLIIIISFSRVWGAFEDKKPGARSAGLGGAGIAIAEDATAVYYNPGGLGYIRNVQALFTRTELFSIDDLAYDWAGVIVPLDKTITVAATYSQFGPDLYREITSTLGIGWAYTRHVSFGVSVARMDLRIKDYGSAHDWAGSIGFLGKITDTVWIGMRGRNVFSTHLGTTDEMPERGLGLGARFEPKEYLMTVVETERTVHDEQITYRFGQEVQLVKLLVFRFGFHNYPDRLSGGLGIAWKDVRIDYGIVTHPRLDLQHQFSLLVGW